MNTKKTFGYLMHILGGCNYLKNCDGCPLIENPSVCPTRVSKLAQGGSKNDRDLKCEK